MAAYFAELGAEHRPWRWALAFPYDPAMVAAIKTCIPSRRRVYKPELRQWWLRNDVREAALALAMAHYGRVEHVKAITASTLPAELAAAYRTLHLLPNAPDELVRASYHVLCKRYHPDAGGTTAQMQRVNEAYSILVRQQRSRNEERWTQSH